MATALKHMWLLHLKYRNINNTSIFSLKTQKKQCFCLISLVQQILGVSFSKTKVEQITKTAIFQLIKRHNFGTEKVLSQSRAWSAIVIKLMYEFQTIYFREACY